MHCHRVNAFGQRKIPLLFTPPATEFGEFWPRKNAPRFGHCNYLCASYCRAHRHWANLVLGQVWLVRFRCSNFLWFGPSPDWQLGLHLMVWYLNTYKLKQHLCDWFLSSWLQLSTLNQKPQSCRDQTLCNSPFLLPSNLIHVENRTTWHRDPKMEEKRMKTVLRKNHSVKRTSSERGENKKKTFRNEIWDSDDDVLLQAISAATLWWHAWYCLDMSASCYTVSLFGLHPLSGADYRTLLREESKHQAELQARAPCRAYVGSGGK